MPSQGLRSFVTACTVALLASCQAYHAQQDDPLTQLHYVAQVCLTPKQPIPLLVATAVINRSSHATGGFKWLEMAANGQAVYEGLAGDYRQTLFLVVKPSPDTQFVWQLDRFANNPKGNWSAWSTANFITDDKNFAWAVNNEQAYARSEAAPNAGPRVRVMILTYSEYLAAKRERSVPTPTLPPC